MTLNFVCPSCGKKLAPVESSDSATQVVRRTCRNKECRETWQLKVTCLQPEVYARHPRMDKAEFTFLGHAADWPVPQA